MPHAFYRNYQHIVFSTKGRRRFLRRPILAIVHESIKKTCRDYRITILEMGGVEDHMHLLVNISPKHSVANIVRAIKGNSSILLNEQDHLFAWQLGYSAFSVSESNLPAVRHYIAGQERHHRRQSFAQEFVALLRKHGILQKETCPSGEPCLGTLSHGNSRGLGKTPSGPDDSICHNEPALMDAPHQQFIVEEEEAFTRLDQFLVSRLPDVSRARVQALIEDAKILVDGKLSKPSHKLRGGETIEVIGEYQPPPLRAIAEDIALDVIYEDEDLAIVNKPAGMMVHAGAGPTEDARNRGTLVNALLHRFQSLSEIGGDLRPGIVHRLDKETSGLIVVAKNDLAHRKLAEQFSSRKVHKTYIALVHGWPKKLKGTINSPIARDVSKRTRMTTRGPGGRDAVSHYQVTEKVESPYGKFALVEVKIETGRTHQIRVHMASLGHPVVGDNLYGAPGELRVTKAVKGIASKIPSLDRNFLHAAALELQQPRTAKALSFRSQLPAELQVFLENLRDPKPRAD